jgi:hypothetical protein
MTPEQLITQIIKEEEAKAEAKLQRVLLNPKQERKLLVRVALAQRAMTEDTRVTDDTPLAFMNTLEN